MPIEELSPEAQQMLDRLKAAKEDQRTHHAGSIEYLECARAMLSQLCAVCSPEHMPGRYRSREVIRRKAEALQFHVRDLLSEINPK